MAASRGTALGLAILLGLNVFEVLYHASDATQCWLGRLTILTHPVALVIIAMAGTSLTLFAVKPDVDQPVRIAALLPLFGISLVAVLDAWQLRNHVPNSERTDLLTRPLGYLMLFFVAGIGVLRGRRYHWDRGSSILQIIACTLVAILAFCVCTVISGYVSDPLPQHIDGVVLICEPASAPGENPPESEFEDGDGNGRSGRETLSDEERRQIRIAAKIAETRNNVRVFVFNPAYGESTARENGAPSMSADSAEQFRHTVTNLGIPAEKLVLNTSVSDVDSVMRLLALRPGTSEDRSRYVLISVPHRKAIAGAAATRHGVNLSTISSGTGVSASSSLKNAILESLRLLQYLAEPAIRQLTG